MMNDRRRMRLQVHIVQGVIGHVPKLTFAAHAVPVVDRTRGNAPVEHAQRRVKLIRQNIFEVVEHYFGAVTGDEDYGMDRLIDDSPWRTRQHTDPAFISELKLKALAEPVAPGAGDHPAN